MEDRQKDELNEDVERLISKLDKKEIKTLIIYLQTLFEIDESS